MLQIKRKHIDNTGLLFCDFIAEKEAEGLSKKSLDNYREVFHRYTLEIGKPLSKESITEWVKKFVDNGTNPISINFYLNQIRVFVNWLSKNGHIKPFVIKKMKCQEAQIKVFTDDEMMLLLKKPVVKASYAEYRNWAIVNFIIGTGARASTVINTLIRDLDFSAKEIKFNHLKNKKAAIVPMSKGLERALKYYLNAWEIGDSYLFLDRFGNQMTLNALVKCVRAYCELRGVKPRGPHSLRHTFARKFIISGGNAFTLQRLLTHTDLTMTKKYVRLFNNDLHTNFDNLCPLDTFQSSKLIKRK